MGASQASQASQVVFAYFVYSLAQLCRCLLEQQIKHLLIFSTWPLKDKHKSQKKEGGYIGSLFCSTFSMFWFKCIK